MAFFVASQDAHGEFYQELLNATAIEVSSDDDVQFSEPVTRGGAVEEQVAAVVERQSSVSTAAANANGVSPGPASSSSFLVPLFRGRGVREGIAPADVVSTESAPGNVGFFDVAALAAVVPSHKRLRTHGRGDEDRIGDAGQAALGTPTDDVCERASLGPPMDDVWERAFQPPEDPIEDTVPLEDVQVVPPPAFPERARRARQTKWGRCQRCIGYMRIVYPSRDGGEAFLGCSQYRAAKPDSCRYTCSIPPDRLHELNDQTVVRRRVFI